MYRVYSKFEMQQEEPVAIVDPLPGSRNLSIRTIIREKQLKDNPGVWFLWSEHNTYRSTTTILATLMHVPMTKFNKQNGYEVDKLPYETTIRRQPNGTYKKYVRYIGENREYA